MELNQYTYDENSVRYQLVKSNPGQTNNNWLFFPGGPGVDADYFRTLIDGLDVMGNFWLIDFPANGTNLSEHIQRDYDFDTWGDCLIPAIKRFQNPICVGHSFGGQFLLLYPELEDLLKGVVLLCASPCLWQEEANKRALENDIVVFTEPIKELEKNPNPETLRNALLACAPFYFPENNLEKGKKLLEKIQMNYFAANWWLKKVEEINFNAKWIPQTTPTLIIGGSHDFMTPHTLFENDMRFHRDNIIMKKVENAGHFPWLEQMGNVKELFREFENLIK